MIELSFERDLQQIKKTDVNINKVSDLNNFIRMALAQFYFDDRLFMSVLDFNGKTQLASQFYAATKEIYQAGKLAWKFIDTMRTAFLPDARSEIMWIRKMKNHNYDKAVTVADKIIEPYQNQVREIAKSNYSEFTDKYVETKTI